MTSLLNTLGHALYKLAYQLSPIILHNGIAEFMPGAMLPLIILTEPVNFLSGVLHGDITIDTPDRYFAHFRPLPGTTLAEYQIGHYPLANQQVAANSTIAQPLRVSLRMDAPVQTAGGYTTKLATMIALKAAISKHVNSGGTFHVVTPSRIYTDCLLLGIKDVSDGQAQQPQNAWQWDFEQPLVTLDAVAGAQNNFMALITNGGVTGGALAGPAQTAANALSGGQIAIPAALLSPGAVPTVPVLSAPVPPVGAP